MQSRSLGLVLTLSTALGGCATFRLPEIGYDDEQPAVLQSDPPSLFRLSRCRSCCRCRASSGRGRHPSQMLDGATFPTWNAERRSLSYNGADHFRDPPRVSNYVCPKSATVAIALPSVITVVLAIPLVLGATGRRVPKR
jgi:hypothetical protein